MNLPSEMPNARGHRLQLSTRKHIHLRLVRRRGGSPVLLQHCGRRAEAQHGVRHLQSVVELCASEMVTFAVIPGNSLRSVLSTVITTS